MHWNTLRYRERIIIFAVAFTAAMSGGTSAIANPSQVQYGYDPIVDAGGSGPGQSGPNDDAASGDAARKVDRASAIIARILGSEQENEKGPSAGGQGVAVGGAGANRPGAQAFRATERSSPDGGRGILTAGSVWLLLIILTLGLGLVLWAVIQRRELRGGSIDLVVRLLSVAAFVALIVILNGSAGSILG